MQSLEVGLKEGGARVRKGVVFAAIIMIVGILVTPSRSILPIYVARAINEPPLADADGPYDGTEGVTIAFDGSGSYDPDGTIISYFWDFGDGETSTEQNPTHTYTQNGTYTVTLTVTDDDSATDMNTTTATVADTNPTANFSATPTSGPEPLTVSFTDLSASYDGIEDWEWDFDNDAVVDSTEQNPIHEYNQDGVYTVTLTVYESDGNSATETKADYIVVSDAEPIADFTGSLTSGPEPLTVNFIDASTSHDGIISWDWTFGDGETSTEQNPIHTYTSVGLYAVSLTVSETDGDSHTEIKDPYIIVEDSTPTASFTYSPSIPLEGELVTFNATGSTGYDEPLSYSWDFGDAAVGEGICPTHIYAQDGDYLVTLTVTDADESTDSVSQTISVRDTAPVAEFSASPTNGATPLTVGFTDLSTSYDGITSWTWNFGDGTTSAEPNPTHIYTAEGTYTVSLTVIEGDGSSDVETKIHYITVTDTLGVGVDISTDKSVYAPGETIVVTLTVTNPTDTSYPSSRVTVNITWPSGDGMLIFDSGPFTLPFGFNRTVSGSLLIPDSILVPDGTYIFTATLIYNSNTATDTASFEIRRSL